MARPPEEIAMMPEKVSAPKPKPPPPPAQTPLPKSNAPDPRQTVSYLRGLMENFRLEPKSKLGQNFLIDLNLIDLIVRAGDITSADSILEVGTGTGSLTNKLADWAACVFTVEVDKSFHRMAQTFIGHRLNVVSHLGDALERKNELNPDMLAGWAELTAKFHAKKLKLISNLPYAVATPIITNLLLLPDLPIDRMVVMVQWEIAERLRATVGTKDYNSLSVLVQSVADVETIRKVGPSNFFPRPQVDSGIVMIKPNPEKRAKVGDVVRFRVFLRDLYCHRRKNLRAALIGWPSGRRDKDEVDSKLKDLGIDGGLRAEALDLEQHLRLSNTFG